MGPAELDAFLSVEPTCRLATSGPAGPHVTPVWFVWHDSALWFSSLVHSQRWMDLVRDPRCAAVVDAGVTYGDLRGVELRGEVATVGDVPRSGTTVSGLDDVERLFDAKYPGAKAYDDGRHAWLRLTPQRVVSWDFRKLRASGPADT